MVPLHTLVHMPTYLVLSASVLSLHIKRYWIDPTYTFNIVAKRVLMIQSVICIRPIVCMKYWGSSGRKGCLLYENFKELFLMDFDYSESLN